MKGELSEENNSKLEAARWEFRLRVYSRKSLTRLLFCAGGIVPFPAATLLNFPAPYLHVAIVPPSPDTTRGRWIFTATFINYAMAHWTRKSYTNIKVDRPSGPLAKALPIVICVVTPSPRPRRRSSSCRRASVRTPSLQVSRAAPSATTHTPPQPTSNKNKIGKSTGTTQHGYR